MHTLGSIATSKFSSSTVISCFGGMTTVSMSLGGFAAAQLVSAHTEHQGQHLPTKQRPYHRGADDRRTTDRLRVFIDFSNIRYN
jgi:hypothetical protein